MEKIVPYSLLVVGGSIAIAANFNEDAYASLIGLGTGLIVVAISGMWIDLKEGIKWH